MLRHRPISKWLALAALLAGAPAHAYDPATTWRTLSSPSFRVHYPEGYDDAALDSARAAEHAFEVLTERLGWRPDTPIDIVLADETDSANGFARNYPYNLIGINAVAPDDMSVLSDYDDWLYLLLAHELTHIVHIDTIRGLPRIINALFGRLMVPNGVQPLWFIEGLAVYFETQLTSTGRLRSAFFDMMLRMHVLAGRTMELDEMSGAPRRWPQGTTAYLYGAHLIDYVARRFGEDALRAISHDYGGQLIPFAVNVSAAQATGHTYAQIYGDFVRFLEARYEAQAGEVGRRGRVEGEALTSRGQQIGPARLSSDGMLYFVESPVGERAQLRVMDPGGRERRVAWLESGAELALLPDGARALVVQPEITDTYYVYGDFFTVDLESGDVERLTRGMRAHGPDVSADGERVVFAQNHGGHSVLRIAPRSFASVETLADLGPNTQVWTPRFSRDGRSVVFSGFRGGQRDLYRVDLETRAVERLTNDRALDGAPVFSPDGAWILFHSDRGGIYDLFAVPAEGGAPRRLTRVLGGAFQPEPSADGARLVYRSYGAEGFDLAQLELGALATQPFAEPMSADGPPLRVEVSADVYPSDDYRPWRSLVPRAWLPLLGQDAVGPIVGAQLTGQDAVGRHGYALQGWWGLDSELPGFALSYRNRAFRPGVDLFASYRVDFAAAPYVRNGEAESVEEEVWSGTASTSWPLVRLLDESLSLVTAYDLRYRQPYARLDVAPQDSENVFPDFGRFASAFVGLSYGNARSFIDSISPEQGGRVDLGVRLEAPWLGSEYRSTTGTLSLTGYLENPWLERHVLAANVFAGYGESNYRRRRLFGIGGLPTSDLLLDIVNFNFGASQGLRGFPTTPFAGDALLEGHLEYRFPLVDLDRGLYTLPIFLRSFHLAPFLDAAAIADEPADWWDNQHYSVGLEARLGLLIAYGIPTTLRAGYGHGLGRDSDEQSFFLVLGGYF